MPLKRKMHIKKSDAIEILKCDNSDYLGILDKEEEEEESDEDPALDKKIDSLLNEDGKPDDDDPYYYDKRASLHKEIAYYKGTKDKDSDTVEKAKSIEHEESGEEDTDWETDSNATSEAMSDESEEEGDESDKEEHDNMGENNVDHKHKSKRKAKKSLIMSNGLTGSFDEYADGDSSDEEEIRNTIGNVPVEWYDEYDHIGYDLSGEKILKPDRGDSLDAFLRRIEDPNYMRTVVDRLTGQDVQLVEGDLELVHRLVRAQVPSAQYDLYEPFLDLYSHEVMEMPLSGRPEHKRSFLPSRSERKKVSRMVSAIKGGAIHPHRREKRYQIYDLWKSDTVPVPMRRRLNPDYKAPPARLPTNSNSYNPPPEFLPTKRQLKWLDKKSERERKLLEARLPTKYNSLREVPTHHTFVMDIFNRCLDLYMSSRFAYRKVQGHSKDLLPNLPRPRDLRPYPTRECLLFEGHKSIVRSLSVHPMGKILATGADDHTVRVWEISTSRCLFTLDVGDAVHSLAWNPNNRVLLLAVAVGRCVLMINPETYLTDKTVVTRTNALFVKKPDQGDYVESDQVKKTVQWVMPSFEERSRGYRIVLRHTHDVKQVVWHQQGDYFATLQPEAYSSAVLIHQLARWRSQIPFSRSAVRVTALSFHPKKAYFYICSQGRVRVYSLLEKKLIRLIRTNSSSQWLSSIAVHPSGEHFIVGSQGKRITWYEMECTNRPYTLRYHHGAVRSVDFHSKYPLFASASDDGRVIISHCMVYSDWLKDPLLVPVKELRNHQMLDGLCVLQVAWHPQDPCLFTAGADGTVRMWQ